MTMTWEEAQQPWLATAARLGIHPDDVHGWMLDTTIRCGACGTPSLDGAALCAACKEKRLTLIESMRPVNIARRQGVIIPLSDYKRDPKSQRNATLDEHGLFGLTVGGTDL